MTLPGNRILVYGLRGECSNH